MNQNNEDLQLSVFEIDVNDDETDVVFFEQAVRITNNWVGGANNDINVLDNSPLFDDLLNDTAHVLPYVVNGVGYEKGYYLADGIYPQWATFVKSFTIANDAKHAYFKKRQECARKDVERAFGVLQGRWGIIQQPARSYHVNTLRRVMKDLVFPVVLIHLLIKSCKTTSGKKSMSSEATSPDNHMFAVDRRLNIMSGGSTSSNKATLDESASAKELKSDSPLFLDELQVGRYLSTDVVVSDAQGNAIHCSAWSNVAHNFIKLKKGIIYCIKNCVVHLNKEEYRIRKDDAFMLKFNGATSARKSLAKAAGFVRHPFQLVELDSMELTDNKYMIDVAGYVTNVRRSIQQRTRSRTMDFYLANESSSTQTFDDPNILALKELRSKIRGADQTLQILQIKPVDFGQPRAGTLENLLLWARNRRNESVTFIFQVQIDDIKTRNGWHFPMCGGEKCKKGVGKKQGDGGVTPAIKQYRLELGISDATVHVVVVMFDETVSELVKCSTDSLAQSDEEVPSSHEHFLRQPARRTNIRMQGQAWVPLSQKTPRRAAYNSAGVSVSYQTLGPTTYQCPYCRANMWYEEISNKAKRAANLTFSIFYQEGKVCLSKFHEAPPPLNMLLNYTDPATVKFKEKIRVYNSMLYFTSFGARIDHSINTGRAPYTFRINGQNYHRIGSLLPKEGIQPRFHEKIPYHTNEGFRKTNHGFVTMKEFYAYIFQQQNDQGTTLLRGGRLFLEYLVDAFTAIEEQRLKWSRNNQDTLRADLYHNVCDAVTNGGHKRRRAREKNSPGWDFHSHETKLSPAQSTHGDPAGFRPLACFTPKGGDRCFNVGDGTMPTKKQREDEATWIEIPERFLIKEWTNPIEQIVQETYLDFTTRQHDDDYLKERAILTPRNDDADAINAYMFKKLAGDTITYNSADEICKASTNTLEQYNLYPVEFLNSLNFPSIPPHSLCL
nr:ATP-dependent DNA helicase PIF1-like [Tanacetum cinerariifolium]